MHQAGIVIILKFFYFAQTTLIRKNLFVFSTSRESLFFINIFLPSVCSFCLVDKEIGNEEEEEATVVVMLQLDEYIYLVEKNSVGRTLRDT